MQRNKINIMLKRADRCVCHYCGNPITMQTVIYNRYGGAGAELYCKHCDKIEFGTEPEIYAAAKQFIDEMEFDYYFNMEANEESYQANIAKVCEILSYCAKQAGLLDEDGLHIARADGEDESNE